MQEIYVDNINEVLRNKKNIEKELNVIILNKGKLVFIKGNAENEFLTLNVLGAINCGFSLDKSLKLKDEHCMIYTLHIKDLTRRRDLNIIRGRIIGTKGKTLKTLKQLTHCDFATKDNSVSIIGDADEIEDAIQALKSIVYGSKHGNVYGRLEKRRKEKKTENRY